MRITINNLQKKLPIYPVKIKKLITNILKNEKITSSGWINLCFVNASQIKKFNAKFHKTNTTTDVLAFNLGEKRKKIIIADIMISTDSAIKQSRAFKTTPGYELSLYIVHGMLHILGFNDRTPAQIKLMRKKEKQYVH